MKIVKGFTAKVFFDNIGRFITVKLKNRSDTILRLWIDRCETIVSQRLRRGQQMFTYYSKLWEDQAIRDLLIHLRRQFQRRSKYLLVSSASVLPFEWDHERITYDSITNHLDELERVNQLKHETIMCNVCKKRTQINAKIVGIEYCTCSKDGNRKATQHETARGRWQPYLEKENIIVWRRRENNGLYSYKVYASYPDISAEDFLFVQTDIEYRKVWDKTAVELKIVDTDPSNHKNSHIVYWELQWPKLFANRDYVFNRRYFIDRSRKIIGIFSKSIEHPCCPAVPTNHRVREYWSYMIIKPKENFKKPGLEYVLTYFDNPGVILPPPITTWVAQKQMPDFLGKLYQATVEYSQQRKQIEDKDPWRKIRDPGFEYPPEPDFFYGNDYVDNDDDDADNGDSNKGSGDKNKKIELEEPEDVNVITNKNAQPTGHWWSFFFATASANPKQK